MTSIRTAGRKGAMSIEVEGVADVMRRLRLAGHKIEDGADTGVVKAGTFIVEEVGESIGGNRAETKSVDSGLLLSSIRFERTGKAQGIVKPQKKHYPNSRTTTEDVALFMEMGTTNRPYPRWHFRNTEKRNKKNVKKIIERWIKLKKL